MANSQAPWSIRMADTVLARWADLPPAWSHEYGALFQGLLEVWKQTEDPRYLDYVKKHIDAVVDPQGRIAGYDKDKYKLDDLVSGRMLFTLLDRTGDPRYRQAAATLREQYRTHPRTSDGGFWHAGALANQMWLDGAYMGAPFYAEYAVRHEDREALDDAVRQPILLREHCRNAESGLLYHGWDESKQQAWADRKTGCSPSFWGRCTGWYFMALSDLLDIVPFSHPRYLELLATYRGLAWALLAVRTPDGGLWRLVLDQGERAGNYVEASATFMFLYGLGRGVSRGILPEGVFREAARKGFTAARSLLVRSDGKLLSVKDVCKTAGLGVKPGRDGSFGYYISEPVVENDLKGVAAFLLAASACEGLDLPC